MQPDLVVNAAAYTAVEQAETEQALAMQINGISPGLIASAARSVGALFVHYSTDYVFDGTKSDAYVETDTPCPINVYGRTKLAGEEHIRASGCNYLIFRTSWVFASRGRNFVRTILDVARNRRELRVVADQIGAPTWARSIAGATVQVARGVLESGEAESPTRKALEGIYHMTATGTTSWYEFARAITANALPPQHRPQIVPVPTAEYRTLAPRPLNSRLDNGKLERTFGVTLPSWQDNLASVLAELAASQQP
jgi:dTDP-4-dehydrorhamnose reductase